MFIRVLTLIGGLLGAGVFSQYPEFTQQYMQRLAGRVDALREVVADFDASAAKASLTRDEALAAMGGTVFLDNRRLDMRNTIAREARLSADLERLRTASPMERLIMPQRVADTELARATWGDFTPALPFSVEGAVAATGGFLAGWALIAALLHFLAWPFRRRKAKDGLTF